MSTKDQLFRGKEIEALMRAAARLQNEKEEQGAGLSPAEMEAIAEEAGIDPKYMRQAILLMGETDEEGKFHLFGGPAYVRDRFVIERPLDKLQREDLIPAIDKFMGQRSAIESLEKSMTWWPRNSSQGNDLGHVRLTTTADQTIVDIKEPVWFPGFMIYFFPLLLLFVTGFPIAVTFPSPILIPILIAATLTVLFLARFAYGRLHERKKSKVAGLKEVLVESVGDPEEEQARPQIEIPEEGEFESQPRRDRSRERS